MVWRWQKSIESSNSPLNPALNRLVMQYRAAANQAIIDFRDSDRHRDATNYFCSLVAQQGASSDHMTYFVSVWTFPLLVLHIFLFYSFMYFLPYTFSRIYSLAFRRGNCLNFLFITYLGRLVTIYFSQKQNSLQTSLPAPLIWRGRRNSGRVNGNLGKHIDWDTYQKILFSRTLIICTITCFCERNI